MILEHRFDHIPQDARRGRAWLVNLTPLYEGSLAEGTVVPPGAFLRHHHLGEIVLSVEAGPGQAIERTQRLVAAQALDHLVLRAHADGKARITAGPRCAEAGPGDLALLDLARPVRITTPATMVVAVVLPRRILSSAGRGYDGEGWHGRVLPGDGDPLAALLAQHLLRLAGCLIAATEAQVRHLVSATRALCEALVAGREGGGPCGDGPGGDAASDAEPPGVVIRRYIEANLTTVDVGDLIARFGLSRRSLYRVFENDGGVEAHIRDRRLARAWRELGGPRTGRRPKLARLAHECGFSDARVFSRAFRRRYGHAPMAIESRPAEPPAPGAETGLMRWLREL